MQRPNSNFQLSTLTDNNTIAKLYHSIPFNTTMNQWLYEDEEEEVMAPYTLLTLGTVKCNDYSMQPIVS